MTTTSSKPPTPAPKNLKDFHVPPTVLRGPLTDVPRSPFSVKNVQQCRCGAPTCRGVLGPRPKEHRGGGAGAKELRALVRPIVAGAKRKLQLARDDGLDGAAAKRRKVAVAAPRAGRKGGR